MGAAAPSVQEALSGCWLWVLSRCGAQSRSPYSKAPESVDLILFFFFFSFLATSHMDPPAPTSGQGSDLSHSLDLSHSCGNTGSF